MSHSAIYKSEKETVVVKFLFFPRNNYELNNFKNEVDHLHQVADFPYGNLIAKPLSKLIKHPKFQIFYYLQEYVDGISVKSYLEKKGTVLKNSDAISILRRCAHALNVISTSLIIHCDLHAGNIILLNSHNEKNKDDPGVRIIDYGLSKNWLQDAYYGYKGENLRHFGAVSSWSPESLKTPEQLTIKHDIWGLGCLFFELITGKWAFEGSSFEKYYGSIVKGSYNKKEIPNNTDNELFNFLLRRMFDVNPETRITSASICKICDDYLNGTLNAIKEKTDIQEFYFNNDGDVWECLRCHNLVRPNGNMCPSCGNGEEEYLSLEFFLNHSK